MSLAFRGIVDVGELEKERAVFRATEDVNIGAYALFCCRAGSKDGTVVAGYLPAAYWFYDRKVKKNDFVIVYTKKGKSSEKEGPDGNTSFFFYWGLEKPLWSGYGAVLAEIGGSWTRYGPFETPPSE
jgi:hypothetical protein